jgi:hypothetical protein
MALPSIDVDSMNLDQVRQALRAIESAFMIYNGNVDLIEMGRAGTTYETWRRLRERLRRSSGMPKVVGDVKA